MPVVVAVEFTMLAMFETITVPDVHVVGTCSWYMYTFGDIQSTYTM